MATWTREGYYSAAWNVIAGNVAFAGSEGFDDTVEVGAWQDGTYEVTSTPGSELHQLNNVKYVDSTHFDSGGGSEVLNDTNLAEVECSLRWHFNHGSAVKMQNMALFAYDGSVEADPAPGVEIQAFERGVGAEAWTEINDASESVGGSGSAMSLGAKAEEATDLYFFLAISWSPEEVGAKVGAKLCIAGEYY